MDQSSLFEEESPEPGPEPRAEAPVAKAHQPLAARMRPRRLSEVVGQEHILKEGSLLPRLVAQNQMFSDLLVQHGIRHTFVTIPGAHTWHVWRRNLRDFVPLLFQK